MAIYYLDENTGNRNTAGSKAPTDISELCEKMGFFPLQMPSIWLEKHPRLRHAEEAIKLKRYWRKANRTLERDDIFIYQHPTLGKPLAYKGLKKLIEKKNVKIITLIHDLESLRGGISGMIKVNTSSINQFDNYILHKSSCIISHNNRMKEYICKQEIVDNIVINLELFDYLHGTQRKEKETERLSIAIAGNLSAQKSGYIYSINNNNPDLLVHLYGKYFDLSRNCGNNVKYHGSFSPEELGGVMEGAFGLVWDGPSTTSCEGNTGHYLKYNNPHKASMYLSAGIPVIVWSQAAISQFVQDNNVGIVVDSLDDLQKVIRSISEDEYIKMCENTMKIAEKLQEGHFFNNAIKKAIEFLNRIS